MDQQYGLELLKENQELRQKLEQYKETLRLAVIDAEKEIGCPPVERRDCNKWSGDYGPCIECIANYYLTKAKGGQ